MTTSSPLSPSDTTRARLLALWRVFCPIHLYEAKKFLALTFLMFCVLYVYNTMRGLKDSIVVTSIGAEVISVVKFYGVLPGAFLLMLLYMKLSNHYSQERIFYIFSAAFTLFFALFAFYLYPHQLSIHMAPEEVEALVRAHPYFQWQIRIIGKWSFALFYMSAELWGSAMLNLMFWGFANHICRTNEAKRYYSLLGFVGNGAIILAGVTLSYVSSEPHGDSDLASNVHMIQTAMSFIVFACISMMGIYWAIQRYVLTDPLLYTPKEDAHYVKARRSLWDSLKVVASSHYLRLIAILVLSYGISINLVEGPWKAKAREIFPTPLEYAQFAGEFLQWQGIALIPMMLIGSNIIRRFGWFAGAITTPIVIVLTGIIFYSCVIFDKAVDSISLTLFYCTPLVLAVFVGALQNILSKAAKYSMYDATKEMAYIPINQELRTKGKSAVDVVGSRLAKSAGALIQSSIFMILPTASYTDITPFLATIFLVVMVVWLVTVKRLNRAYLALSPDTV